MSGIAIENNEMLGERSLGRMLERVSVFALDAPGN